MAPLPAASPFTDGAISSESELEEHVYVGDAARPARHRSRLPWFLAERHEEEEVMFEQETFVPLRVSEFSEDESKSPSPN